MDLSKPIQNNPTFHLELKELRRQLGFDTVTAFADATGILPSSIYQWEKPFESGVVNGVTSSMTRPGPSNREKLLKFAQKNGWKHEDLLKLSDQFAKKKLAAKSVTPSPVPATPVEGLTEKNFTLTHISISVTTDELANMSPRARATIIETLDYVMRKNAVAIATAAEIKAQIEALK